MQTSNTKPDDEQLGTIPAVGRNQATVPKSHSKLDITKNKEASIEANAGGKVNEKVSSDGSTHDGKVVRAAILMRVGAPPSRARPP